MDFLVECVPSSNLLGGFLLFGAKNGFYRIEIARLTCGVGEIGTVFQRCCVELCVATIHIECQILVITGK